MAGAETREHQHAEQVDQRHDGGIGHCCKGNPGAAVEAGGQGSADVVVEADTALEDRGEVSAVVVDYDYCCCNIVLNDISNVTTV